MLKIVAEMDATLDRDDILFDWLDTQVTKHGPVHGLYWLRTNYYANTTDFE